MKKQVKEQIEKLVKSFNNDGISRKFKYEVKTIQYKRGHYSVYIFYSLFYSDDFGKLIQVITENNLLASSASINEHDLAYITLI